MKEKGIQRTIKGKYHLYFWTIYFLFNFLRWGSYFNDYWYSLKSNLVEFPLHIIIVYFNIYYLVPRFILRKKCATYIVLLLGSLGVHYLLRSGLNYWLVTENIWPEVQGKHSPFGFNHMVAVVLGEIYVIGLTAAIKFMVDFMYERNQNTLLHELQAKTELKYLKAQIQPHFFFNTLNNIYALTKMKSDQASEVVLKLSDIMKYIIYEANKKKVTLLKEITYIDNYIELQKVRYGYRVDSVIDITGNVDEVMIPPLLFLPFIENSFKHGMSGEKKMRLEVSFERTVDELTFYSKNNFERSEGDHEAGGIGLKNMERRLQLLYKKNYVLYIAQENENFIVRLKIPIK